MPTLYLSPSLQPYNKYVTTGDEQYWMNIIADGMVPILSLIHILPRTRQLPITLKPFLIKKSKAG